MDTMAAFTAALAGAAVALLSADVLRAVKAWNMAPALVERRDGPLPAPVLSLAQKIRGLGTRLDPAVWEEVCYALAFHLRAGETPAQAVRGVGAEGENFAHVALQKAAQAYESGTAMPSALESQSKQHPELGQIAAVVEMGSTSGGDIPMLLCHAAESMRRRRLQRGDLRSRLTEARATAALLSLLPWGIGAFTYAQDPDSAHVVLGDPRGRSLLAFAVVAWLAGNVVVVSILRTLLPGRRTGNAKQGSA